MFEKAKPFMHRPDSGPHASPSAGRAPSDGTTRPSRGGEKGGALRAIEWGELTARFQAARDLRELLRRDPSLNIEESAASFGDAAARYFASLSEGEGPVNLDDLEARKASCGISSEVEGNAATGETRDN
jgi:hypothetical protein